MAQHLLFAKAKIDSIYNEIILGNKDFFEVAQQISDDKASAVKGGRLDKFGSGRMVESFADESFKLNNELIVQGILICFCWVVSVGRFFGTRQMRRGQPHQCHYWKNSFGKQHCSVLKKIP